ncbi:hypothetical protein FRACYDRAFT_268196 [Fragilariopsis cylindrus CCMP1102]|uniref:Uncharacterized protein n=1 Tax=Fragilariopsis cylindrus CCMP1102 TaxID=635003 RepID=A0A1E7FPV1_9STRA|nr:hypothetical protein FRACYDRAFT_268196 [Fragilariopsis cylindrus CCMP1102]|eukprot:OEU20192.1 hypothetical protein FRACYDRAFT_268196 [Fragilariopsis cylindrus CCMP1102]
MVYAYSPSISLGVLLIFTLGTMMIVNVNAQSDAVVDNQIMINECESNTSCRDCLSSTSTATTTCGWVNGMGCLESCNIIADVGCYDIENFNGNDGLMTGDDICTVAENDIANSELCDSQIDCTTCIETSLLVASSSWKPIAAATTKCKWFSDMNFCGSECNMIGCGESTCTTADSETDNESSDLIMEASGTPATTPSSSSVDAVKSSTAAKKKSNYSLVWTVTATATLMVVVASCLL